ncbi:MAG: ABC transporter ATP-binding protein [Clostridia bacterium]|nr:ABC transporter ATP-binding protein [Clostridia bacterium]
MLEIKNLFCHYGKRCVLENINLSFEEGKFYAVIGKNSSGKSTLINCISGVKGYGGSIVCDGRDLKSISDKERAETISCLYQNATQSSFTVREMCAFGRSAFRDEKAERESRVDRALEKAGISHLAQRRACEVSGGERQLCYFAMNLCQDAHILLLDEPTSNLDAEHEALLLSAAKGMCCEGKTVICVIHNLSRAIKYADNVVVIDGGKCVFSGRKEECLEKNVIEKNFGVKKYAVNDEIFFAV